MSIEDDIKAALAAEGINGDEAVEKANEPETKESTAEAPSKDIDLSKYSEFEQEQIAKGWDPDGVKSAEEYSRAEPLFDKIKHQSKELKQMRRALDELKALSTKQEQAAYERALQTLRQEKQDAILRGDVNAVMDVERRQEELSTRPAEPPAAVVEFKEKYDNIFNSANYEEMQIANFLRVRDSELMAKGLSPEEHMKTLEQHMLKQFPDYFGNSRETVSKSNSVEAGINNNVVRKGNKRYTLQDLNSEQRQIARDFERLKVMKVDDYIKSLIDLGELK